MDAVARARSEDLPIQANSGVPLVGLNVSGLLFNGGYTHNNMFGLQTDYKALVYELIDFLIRQKGPRFCLCPTSLAQQPIPRVTPSFAGRSGRN